MGRRFFPPCRNPHGRSGHPSRHRHANPSGRPKSDDPKQQVTLRLDAAMLGGFRATDPGWQSRINAELRMALGL
ncbi:BrnA antitoxin family protein [Sphingobium sp. MK2]|uniref:BrnA antitoxin family protein n=1 Tax=Sphingobium sp. MK2 TaxID=3116540 RepID=UPI0032E3591A